LALNNNNKQQLCVNLRCDQLHVTIKTTNNIKYEKLQSWLCFMRLIAVVDGRQAVSAFRCSLTTAINVIIILGQVQVAIAQVLLLLFGGGSPETFEWFLVNFPNCVILSRFVSAQRAIT